MVLSLDDMHLGVGVDVIVFLAAPQRDYAVLGAVDDAYRALKVRRNPINVKFLRLKQIIPAEFEMVEASDELRRVLRSRSVSTRFLPSRAPLQY